VKAYTNDQGIRFVGVMGFRAEQPKGTFALISAVRSPLIVAIVLAACCVVVPIEGQPTGRDPHAHGQQGANTQTPKRKDPAPSTVNIDTVNVDKFNVAKQKADEGSEKPPSYLRRLVAPETLPNTILCLIGIAGVFAAFYTLRESGKATRTMQQSTAIQQAQIVQWVDIEEWSGGEDIWLTDENKFLHHLMFNFYIVNPTNYPMSLSRVDWVVGKQQEGIAINELTFPPRGRHSTIFNRQLTPEEFEVYSKGKLHFFDIEGTVTFVDVSGVERTQHFSVTLHCAFEKGVVGVKPYKTSGWEANKANKKVWEKKSDG